MNAREYETEFKMLRKFGITKEEVEGYLEFFDREDVKKLNRQNYKKRVLNSGRKNDKIIRRSDSENG